MVTHTFEMMQVENKLILIWDHIVSAGLGLFCRCFIAFCIRRQGPPLGPMSLILPPSRSPLADLEGGKHFFNTVREGDSVLFATEDEQDAHNWVMAFYRATGQVTVWKTLPRSAKVDAPGLVNSAPALAYHLCLNLPAAFTPPGKST